MRKLKKSLRFLLPIIIIVFIYYVFPKINNYGDSNDYPLNVHFLDVGQGDCIYINYNDKNIIIDGGSRGAENVIIPYLKRKRIKKIDLAVLTHPHEDHVGGLDDVIKTFPTDKVYVSDCDSTTDSYFSFLEGCQNSDFLVKSAGDKFNIDELNFTVLSPNQTYKEMNDNSLCLKMDFKDKSFIFMGDAEKTAEAEILKMFDDIDADVIKIAHHGSKTASSYKYIKSVSPEYSVISVGRNGYGLPSGEIIKRLSKFSKVLRTDEYGTITISTDGKELIVSYDNSR